MQITTAGDISGQMSITVYPNGTSERTNEFGQLRLDVTLFQFDDCVFDADEDGICDNLDDCVGEYDECGVCNGLEPLNAVAAMSLKAIATAWQPTRCGVCGGDCTEDLDADGICDDVDDCIGVVDACGICDVPVRSTNADALTSLKATAIVMATSSMLWASAAFVSRTSTATASATMLTTVLVKKTRMATATPFQDVRTRRRATTMPKPTPTTAPA